ncbi:MAG TPA: class GN sortase [Thermoanaerobaculia bacterium]|nr:class GN sortase [Thermoanaerobaculia bacterium]
MSRVVLRRGVIGLVALAGLALSARAAWIPAKAGLAQALFHRAWELALEGEARPAPWPGADTWPMARLTAPARRHSVYVLAGASGRTLAFGPAHVAGTARPGTLGNTAIAGHRDTHFAFLKELEVGEELVLELPDGGVHRYRVAAGRVVHESETWVLDPPAAPGAARVLTLITCHPFDAVVPGGAMRYVVAAYGTQSGGSRAPSPPAGGEGRGEGGESVLGIEPVSVEQPGKLVDPRRGPLEHIALLDPRRELADGDLHP